MTDGERFLSRIAEPQRTSDIPEGYKNMAIVVAVVALYVLVLFYDTIPDMIVRGLL